MRRPSTSLLLCAATATTLGVLGLVTGDLPDRVPTHFDAAGRPDGWSTRTGFALEMGGLSLGLAGMFALLGILVARLPTSLVNVPHREFWLAPERRTESMRAIAGHLHVLGAATQVLVLGIVLFCVRASHRNEPVPGPDATTWGLLAGYVAFVILWLVSLHRRFPRPR